MKIIIVNKFYYPRGGDCTYTLSLEQLLKDNGHQVAVFSMDYPMNNSSEFSEYFPKEVSFSEGGIVGKINAVRRLFSPDDVRYKFRKLIRDFSPDVVHLNNIHSYLSPVIAEEAKKQGIKVVWTLHDYKLLCPSYSCLCHDSVCEKCFSNKFSVIFNRCMKNSLPASMLACMEALYWNRKRIESIVDAFICPSEFIFHKMKEGGYDAHKLLVKNNFINPACFNSVNIEKEPFYCYAGRLSKEKGIETLLEVASRLPYKLKVAGTGPLSDALKNTYSSFENIEFLGHLGFEEMSQYISSAKFTVLSSEWYENNPFGIIESLCMGTPVLGALIGGIPELINVSNGMTFSSGNHDDLKQKIEEMYLKHYDYRDIAEKAQARFNSSCYYDSLINIYHE